jgi:hypothetical protein
VASQELLDEIERGEGESLMTAAKRMPSSRKGRPVTMSCVLRWILTGVLDTNGLRVHLDGCRLAGRWLTTPGAIRRFIVAQTPDLHQKPASTKSSTRQQQAAEQAGRKLAKMGC